MSSLTDRAAARIAPASPSVQPLVPEHVRALYAKALTRIPRVRIALRDTGCGERLPAVGSFYG